MTAPTPARWATIALLFVLALAFALRLNALGGEELGLDGLLSVGLAREHWSLFLNFQARDPHPPLYYLLLRGWLALASPTFETARWPSIASGLLSLVLLARIASTLASPSAGVAAALLTALAPAHLFTSVIVRDFAPGLALSLLALWLYPVSHRFRPHARTSQLALALVTAAALLTWYFHALVLLLQIAAALRRPRTARPVLGSLGAGLLLTLPWLALALPHLAPQFLSGHNPFTGEPPKPTPLADFALWVTEGTLGTWPNRAVTMLALPCVVLLSWVVLALRRKALPLFLAAAGSVLGLLIVYTAITRWSGPALASRYLSVALPFLLLGPALALGQTEGLAPDRFARPLRLLWASTLLLALLPMAASYRHLTSLAPFPYSQLPAFRYLREHVQEGDAVLFVDIAWRALYELARIAPAPAFTVHYVGTHAFMDEVQDALDLVTPSLVSARRVWLVNNQPHDPERLKYEALVTERLLELAPLRQITVLEEDPLMLASYGPTVGTTVVSRFGPGAAAPWSPVDALFGNTIRLKAVALPPQAHPGETATLSALWEAHAPPRDDYKVFVHLLDGQGHGVAQHDSVPRLWTRPTSSWRPGEQVRDDHPIPLPPDIAPGTYQLLIGLYDPQRIDRRLPLPNGETALRLGTLLVTAPGEEPEAAALPVLH